MYRGGILEAPGVATQLGAGVALGLTEAAGLDWLGEGAFTGGNMLVLVPSVVAAMTVVGMAAAVVPARRGLAVQPDRRAARGVISAGLRSPATPGRRPSPGTRRSDTRRRT